MTAYDVAASWNKIITPPEGVISARAAYYSMVDKVEAPDPETVIFNLKFTTAAFLPAPPIRMRLFTRKSFSIAILTGSRSRSWAPVRSALKNIRLDNRFQAYAIPITTARACLISTLSAAFSQKSRQFELAPSGRSGCD